MSKVSVSFMFVCAFAALVSLANVSSALGGSKKISGAEWRVAEKTLENSLSKLASGDGPSYKISKIYSVSRQVVEGTIYRYDADLLNDDGDVKSCKIQIWSRAWLPNGNVLTIDCDGEPTVEIKHS